jgi:hypothetical protein
MTVDKGTGKQALIEQLTITIDICGDMFEKRSTLADSLRNALPVSAIE